MKSNPKLKSRLPDETSTLHLRHRQKGPKIPTPATNKKDQSGAKITIKKDHKSPKRRPPPSSDLFPLSISISISTSLSRPISPGGGDESCGWASGGEWSIVLWKKKKKKQTTKEDQKIVRRIREMRERRSVRFGEKRALGEEEEREIIERERERRTDVVKQGGIMQIDDMA